MSSGEIFVLTKFEINLLICSINYQIDNDDLSDDYGNKLYDLRVFLERERNIKFY